MINVKLDIGKDIRDLELIGKGTQGTVYLIDSQRCIKIFKKNIELNHYLLKQKLTPQISNKLIELYEAMVKVGYLRQDAAIFHIFVLPSGELKLIDTAKAMKKKSTIPNLLISGLEDMGYKEDFFNFLKSHRPDFYVQWINYSKKKYKKKC